MARPEPAARAKAFKDGSQVEAAIEEVLHLAEIAMRVLAEAEGVVGAGQRRLDVAQRRVDGQERGMLCAGRAAAGDVRLVQDATCRARP